LLLADGAKVEPKNIIGQTPLFCAVACNNLEGAKILIAHGAKVNRQQDDGRTVLHWAATNGDSKMAEMLIASGAMINAKDYNGKTPLDFALEEKGRTIDPNLIKQYDETIAILRKSPGMK
jgi:ankyrin repeat protein